MVQTPSKKTTLFSRLSLHGDAIWTALWLVTLFLLIVKFVAYQQVNVVGESMEPGYKTNEMLLVNTINKSFKRGQVVAVYEDIEAAKDANYFTRFTTKFYLKRIIALPNEEIEIVGAQVILYNSEYPNGWVIEEPYIGEKARSIEAQKSFYFPRTKISEDSYFVMGDNRSNSTDSRIRGEFPSQALFGQETLRYWPFSTSGLFQLPEYTGKSIDTNLENTRDLYRGIYEKNQSRLEF
jgi:signal peptidase I